MNTLLLAGTIHDEVPEDLGEMLLRDDELLTRWNSLTPLARNEWIGWVTIVKKLETRHDHSEDILAGKKRPCCWPGCPHHRESARKWFPNFSEQ